MKNSFGYLAVVLILFSGCYRAKPRVPETTFFRDFSLASVIERMHIAELKFQSGSEGSSEAFGNSIRRRRNFDLICLIDEKPDAKFDHTRIVNQLDDEIVKLISASGLRMDGRSSGEDSFQLDYSQGEYRGSLDVTSTRVEGNRFKLWAVIRELTPEEKR